MTRDFAQRTLPEGVVLGALSQQVFDVLARHTSFPWPVMQAQCRRENVSPTSLSRDDLSLVLGHLSAAVARFTSPEDGERVREELRALAERSA